MKLIADGRTYDIKVSDGDTILEALRRAFSFYGMPFSLHAECGGRGSCGKCLIEISDSSRPGEKRKVLACSYPAGDDIIIWGESSGQMSVLEGNSLGGLSFSSFHEGFGIACDIGTTTIAIKLVNLEDGTTVFSLGEANAQRSYGSDVISRIVCAEEGRLEDMKNAVRGQIGRMIEVACAKGGIDVCRVKKMSVAANPTMCHIWAGISPASIGKAPFIPKSLFGCEMDSGALGMPFNGQVYILPSVSGYVGGDITGGILRLGIHESSDLSLMIDVGTNGEMALGNKDGIICCSTAAGPAFEGAEISCGMTAREGAISKVFLKNGEISCETIGRAIPKGICGSGLIDAVAALLELGIIDETGRMEEDEFFLAENVSINQSDIRKLQLGKGAIRAGVEILLKETGAALKDISNLYIAGGFGNNINAESAAKIGLFPEELLGVCRAVGNSAADGALLALMSDNPSALMAQVVSKMRYIELSGRKDFSDCYMDSMFFG